VSGATGDRWLPGPAAPRTLTILGGSSPYTLGAVKELAAGPPWPHGVLRLHGRDARSLADVHGCASLLLRPVGWTVERTTDLRTAVEGTDVVLHQNRYGGSAWRAADEELAAGLGLPPDETLGPAGLSAALRTGAGQAPHAEAIARWAPEAAVLTLTNPLGVSTAGFASAGLAVLGLCEVPELTRREVAAAAGVRPEDLAASYTGLNHRGFWHHLRSSGGQDLLPVLLSRLEAGAARLAGADAAVVRDLEAVPDKYHRLLHGEGHLRAGRAAELDRLRTRVLAEARHRPHEPPASLARRDMPWHRVIVLPALRAVAGTPHTLVVTRAAPGGVAEEQRAEVVGPWCRPSTAAPPPPRVQVLYDRLLAHERAVLDAVAAPSLPTVARALARDPSVPSDRVDRAASAVLAGFDRWRADPR
jgi:6-phospho-beta-glucosidase